MGQWARFKDNPEAYDAEAKRRLISLVVQTPTGCWDWQGNADTKGYALFSYRGKCRRAIRVSFQLFIGPIPDGLQLDHLCRNHACVNPNHVEPVTSRENLMRGKTRAAENAAKTHCLRGHPLSGDNLYLRKRVSGDVIRFERFCRQCMRDAMKRYSQRKKGGELSS